MQESFRALLVHHQEEPWTGLTPILERQRVEISRARSCAEAESALWSPDPHLVVLTEPTLPDGSWARILDLAGRAPMPTPVVVVSRYVDVELYLDVLENGAADFIVPPFYASDVAYVLKGALLSVAPAVPVGRTNQRYAASYAC